MRLRLVENQPKANEMKKLVIKRPTISVTDVDGSTTTSTSFEVNDDLKDFLMGQNVDAASNYYKKIWVEDEETSKPRISKLERCRNCIVQ